MNWFFVYVCGICLTGPKAHQPLVSTDTHGTVFSQVHMCTSKHTHTRFPLGSQRQFSSSIPPQGSDGHSVHMLGTTEHYNPIAMVVNYLANTCFLSKECNIGVLQNDFHSEVSCLLHQNVKGYKEEYGPKWEWHYLPPSEVILLSKSEIHPDSGSVHYQWKVNKFLKC